MKVKPLLWRHSAIYPKLGFIDARGVFPIFIFLFHWAYWTLTLAIITIALLVLLERRGLTPLVGLRFFKMYLLCGSRRKTRINEVLIRKRCCW